MKKFSVLFILLSLLGAFTGQAFAMSSAQATSDYSAEWVALGMEKATADAKAEEDVKAVLDSMHNSAADVDFRFESIKERVDELLPSDKRKDRAQEALDTAEDSKDSFLDMTADQELFVQISVGGAPPAVMPSEAFTLAQQQAESDQIAVNRILIAPNQPGAVPGGDLVSDFIPQIIRQMFRFAWLAVLVAFTASGVMLVMAHGDDAKLTKAKSMIYFTLIGTAFVTLAFALVKAVTDIDFFFISK